MRFLRNLSLRQKLMLLVTVTSALVLSLACLALVAYDLRRMRADMETDLVAVAQVIGSNATGALIYDDERTAAEMLAAARAKRHIVSACLYGASGRPFAVYRRKGAEDDVLPGWPAPDGHRAEGRHVTLFQRVWLSGEVAGTLYLKADTDEMSSRVRQYLAVVLAVVLASTAAGSMVSFRLQRVVADPILSLAAAVGAVARSKDYSVRVESPGGGEVRLLTSAFNDLLSQIEQRDAELRAEVREREQAEAALRHAQKMEAVGRLAGGVAHDFNNLLSVIMGYSELLLRESPDSPCAQKIEQVYKAGERAAALTRQLLAFSRKQVLAPKVLDLNSLVAEFARMLPRVLGEDVQMQVLRAEGLGQIKADPGQVEQILMNLAVNARDAMPDGGRLVISTANVTLDEAFVRGQVGLREGRFVMLAVTDTGCGMDAHTQARAFEPFFTTKASGKGTGLGLATVYGIMKQSEGHISVESAPGQGTTFRLYFPRVDEPPDGALLREGEPARSGAETILLVEDEGALRNWLALMLRAYGHTVIAADCAGAALQALDTHAGPVDLLLTDVVMPGMSGRDLADEVTRRRPHTKVVYMSGHAEEVVGQRGVLDPGTRFLAKPFSGTALNRCLREALG